MDNIKCIENLLNIEKNKSNNKIALAMIIDSFSSELSRDNIYYLYDKYINEINENNENTYSNKKRRLN
mgnify:CR=1 FL=1|jgi:hypothetical protein